MKRMARRAFALLPLVILVSSACSSDSSTGPQTTTTTMTQQEALAVASGIFTEISRALSTTTGGLNVAPARASASVMPTQSFNSPCAAGGKIGGSLTYTDNINDAGTGSFTGSMTIAPQGCMISNGTKLIAVGGQWTFDFSINLNQAALVNMTMRGRGTLTWDGGSCSLDYTMNLSGDGHGSVTGTFCGATLNSTV
jgi:hypothetical protein